MDPVLVFFILGILGIAIAVVVSHQKDESRKASIYARYGKNQTAERLIAKTIWVGETSQQLRDSLGAPSDIDQKVLKTKQREIWKYYPKNARSYGLKITVENGYVTGWDEKM